MAASLTRREFLGVGAAAGVALVVKPIARRLPAVPAAPSKPAKLSDIDHVVIMMQENRSFDHYFGRLRGVRGFGDRRYRKSFAQPNGAGDRKSTRLNSSHVEISYAVFCLKK